MSHSSSKARDLRSSKDEGQKVPRWLPITLLTVTTAALTVPAVLLWRQKQALGQHRLLPFARKQLTLAPPVRRRPLNGAPGSSRAEKNARLSMSLSSSISIPPPRRSAFRSKSSNIASVSVQEPSPLVTNSKQATDLFTSLSDGPLLSLGALGIATAAVGVGAVFCVWGIQKLLGVNNVDEFAARVRHILLTYMPELSRRIYRASSEDGNAYSSTSHDGADGQQSDNESDEWSWDTTEDRMREAFDRGGVREWAECAIRELEAEQRVERRRRGL